MINFLRGKVHELTPTYAIIDVNGIGYYVGISLQTSQKLSQGNEAFLYTQQIFREDAQLLFGFSTPREKEVFNLLISVNGVGAVSALILLSSLDIPDIANAVLNNQSVILQKVKGIGAKTAERIIVDLRDKMLKFSDTTEDSLSFVDNKVKEEALSALEVLGISRKMSDKIADKIIKTDPEINVETLVKQILKSI
ncbi:Holliday junction branch migration protein RuvA [Elizabethkingia ursingii]|jgi:Holliday junction DNA helicase RuvA|uniref:Holliday junction branch migration complex subunit RuvA n=1 Tax=Elizabethkingia ursingii TaxID=1756150 RepID=A0AAJ3TNG9_9FLAO|nr:Holliday junction branch migration protein RuvA [Elizabethkingia ursingii]AQX08316.1 Holliday junction DNA helicase RuvA [Elizabethkingia ursingii]KUY29310.1 Holliday junction ATP-dependent DNA helicase RuvA [Elizabethkingia ursingii]MCL1666299.1 Holliday junction branch migration protein RuvA [Elizabethkingia ursingii]MCL1673697.1 Holliday junction branch migration protein RuvA [Elizabethkingia ursingii]OPB72218.1 Holliday junction DNA helicase RuvA [Elizabethkingia ursingii]